MLFSCLEGHSFLSLHVGLQPLQSPEPMPYSPGGLHQPHHTESISLLCVSTATVSATDTILSLFAHASLADTASRLAGNDRREAHMRDGRTGGGPGEQGGDNPQGCICVEEASGCPLQTSCALSGYHQPHHALHCLHWVCLM